MGHRIDNLEPAPYNRGRKRVHATLLGSGSGLAQHRDNDSDTDSGLSPGRQVGGYVLTLHIAGDSFCSVWLTKPEENGFGDTCLRVIPTENLISPGTRNRFIEDLAFWRNMESGGSVPLYDCGCSGGYCYELMRYMPKGSAADQRPGGSWLPEYLVEFALDLAASLRDLHDGVGPHGNLKPSNVFPTRSEGVLLSDYMLPLWLDELEAGSSKLIPRVLHPFRAPEQHQDPRDYDTRSDVFSYGLILLWCLTGSVPPVDRAEAEAKAAGWPEELGRVIRRCLKKKRDKRPADGMELLEAVEEATGRSAPSDLDESPAAGQIEQPARVDLREPVAPHEPLDRAAALDQIHEAEILVEQGQLDEALRRLEVLPPGTHGMLKLLDEIEDRHQNSERLADEAMRLAGMGKLDAAADALDQAEKLWANCETVQAVREELKDAVEYDEAIVDGRVPTKLKDDIEAGRFREARQRLEHALQVGVMTDELRRTVAEFKKARVRKGFLANLAAARREFALGHRDEARTHWLEAAMWLPNGPHRRRLQEIADTAAKGKLVLDSSDLQAPAEDAGDSSTPESREEALTRELEARMQIAATRGKRERNVILLIVAAVVAIIIGAMLAIIIGNTFF